MALRFPERAKFDLARRVVHIRFALSWAYWDGGPAVRDPDPRRWATSRRRRRMRSK